MTHTEAYRLSENPWAQAAIVGSLSLIPARKYPRWVRGVLTWGSTFGVTAVAATPGTATAVLRRLGAWQNQPAEEVQLPEISPAARATLAVSAGAVMYAGWRFSFWSDTATEKALRRLRVPAPRVVMSLAAGALTWRQIHSDNQRRAG